MTWVAAAVAGASVATGAIQYFKGKNDQKRNNRPTYQIPDEAKQNLSLAQQMAAQGLPEQQRQNYIENIQRSNASALSELGSRKAGIAGVAALDQRSKDSYQNLLGMDSQARMANQRYLFEQNQNMANYQDQAFQVNSLNPYYEKTARNEALMGAGLQNVGRGIQMGASAIGRYGQGSYPASNNPYSVPSGYRNSNPGFTNYNPNSVEFNPYNGMYGNDNIQSIYNNIG